MRIFALTCFVSVSASCGHGGVVEGPNGEGATTPANPDVNQDDDEAGPDIATPSGSAPANTPLLLMADGAHLNVVRESLARGEPQFRSALASLEGDANRALAIAELSVMDKKVTPPSGDKHDYMSQAPYYWPDPSKPDGKPYIRKDGERNPEIEDITDRENMGRLSRAVATLSLAFHLGGRRDYADHAARLVRGWFIAPATRMNPNLNYGQGIPGRVDGRSAGIIETRFLPNILVAVSLLERSPAWTISDDRALHEWMADYLTWLIESPLGRNEARRNNNHETWADVQIAGLALYTGQTEVARVILDGARDDIGAAFDPEGRQPRELARTRPWNYSIFNLTAFMALAGIGERLDVDLWSYVPEDGAGMQKGLDWLVPFATGEERFPDPKLDEIRPSELHVVLRRAAVGWNEPRYRETARAIGGGTPGMDLILP